MQNNTLIEWLPADYDQSCWSVIEPGASDAERIRELTAANQQLNNDLVLCRKQQDELRQSLAASIFAGKTKTALHGNLGHALRTPLNAIIGFSDIIGNEIHGPAGHSKYIEYAKHINQAGLQLLQLIIDLLDTTRLEAGDLNLEEEIIDLEDCLTGGLQMLEKQALDRHVFLSCEIANDLPLMYGDHKRVKQIFTTLVGNAIKLTQAGGSVRVSASVLSDGALRVIVADTGAGIVSSALTKVCETYRHAASPLTCSHEPAGLGLPLTKALTESHGGTLEIASEVGRGTIVTVTFPAGGRVTKLAVSHEFAKKNLA